MHGHTYARIHIGASAGDALDAKIAEAIDVLFYDVSVPLEARRAIYRGIESALCMTSIAYAVGRDIELAPWLAEALVDRWFEGQRASLQLFFPLARRQGVEIHDLEPVPGLEELDLPALEAKADLIAEADAIIVQHAARQPTGTWPPTDDAPEPRCVYGTPPEAATSASASARSVENPSPSFA